MSFTSFVSSLFEKRHKIPDQAIADPGHWMLEFNRAAGIHVTSHTVLGYDPVWRAVSIISRTVGCAPLLVYRNAGDSRTPDPAHPAYRLLKQQPSPDVHAMNFFQTAVTQALLDGNSYAVIVRNEFGEPVELIQCEPGTTYTDRGTDGILLYHTTIDNLQGEIVLPPRDMLHIRNISYGRDEGENMVKTARESLGHGMAAEKYGSKFFTNSARPYTTLEHPNQLSLEAKKHLENSWEKAHSGDNAMKTTVLEEGMKVNVFGFNNDEAQFIETLQYRVRTVANLFNIPPHKLGDTSRTSFASLEQENQNFLDETINPWLCNIEMECATKLLTDGEQASESHSVIYDRKSLARADLNARQAFYNAGLLGGWLNPNEVRTAEGFNPYDGGDVYRQQAQMVPVSEGDIPEDQPPVEGSPPTGDPPPDNEGDDDGV